MFITYYRKSDVSSVMYLCMYAVMYVSNNLEFETKFSGKSFMYIKKSNGRRNET